MSGDFPKISVIVPVYNVEKYIRRCLDSIREQSFSDFECILIDDGTRDSSGKICDEYAEKDSRFTVIHKKNGGVSSARNAGLDKARGEYISFIDPDDWIEKETLKTSYECAKEKKVDLVQWNSCIVSENGEKKPFYDVGILKPGFFTLNDCCTCFHGSMCNKIILRKLFCSTQIRFDEDISNCEDRVVALKCYIAAKKCYQLGDFFYNYFYRENSAIHSALTKEKIFEEKHGLEIMQDFSLSENNKNLKKLLLRFKSGCRASAALLLNPPDFNLYRNLFPESKFLLLFSFRKSAVVHWMIFFHFDFLAKFIIEKWRGFKCKRLFKN